MKPLVLFDADCGLCQRTRRVLRALGSGWTTEWAASQSGAGGRYGLEFGALMESIHVVARHQEGAARRIERGFRAAKMILLRTPGFWAVLIAALVMVPSSFWLVALPAAVFFAPPFEPVGERVYRYVAENRGSSCRLPNA